MAGIEEPSRQPMPAQIPRTRQLIGLLALYFLLKIRCTMVKLEEQVPKKHDFSPLCAGSTHPALLGRFNHR